MQKFWFKNFWWIFEIFYIWTFLCSSSRGAICRSSYISSQIFYGTL